MLYAKTSRDKISRRASTRTAARRRERRGEREKPKAPELLVGHRNTASSGVASGRTLGRAQEITAGERTAHNGQQEHPVSGQQGRRETANEEATSAASGSEWQHGQEDADMARNRIYAQDGREERGEGGQHDSQRYSTDAARPRNPVTDQKTARGGKRRRAEARIAHTNAAAETFNPLFSGQSESGGSSGRSSGRSRRVKSQTTRPASPPTTSARAHSNGRIAATEDVEARPNRPKRHGQQNTTRVARAMQQQGGAWEGGQSSAANTDAERRPTAR